MKLWRLLAVGLFALSWAAAQPVISGIRNALGSQTTLAPDSVFAITGTNLGPSTLALPDGQNYQDSLGGTSISFTPTDGGSPIPARMVYSMSTQVSGLLPSSIAPGTYAVTVAYQSQTSAAQNVTVAARSLVLASADGSGNGPAQANDGAVNNSFESDSPHHRQPVRRWDNLDADTGPPRRSRCPMGNRRRRRREQ